MNSGTHFLFPHSHSSLRISAKIVLALVAGWTWLSDQQWQHKPARLARIKIGPRAIGNGLL